MIVIEAYRIDANGPGPKAQIRIDDQDTQFLDHPKLLKETWEFAALTLKHALDRVSTCDDGNVTITFDSP